MSIGLLIITHNQLGADLLDTATGMLERVPLPTRAMSITQDSDMEQSLGEARRIAAEVRGEGGLLVLTDAYGSSPSNIANLLREDPGVEVVAGVNLPMLIRIFNYPGLPLDEMARAAAAGGRAGVLLCGERDGEG